MWREEKEVSYSLVCDDGFAVGAFDGEGFFARVGVWRLEGKGCARWGCEEDFFAGETDEVLGTFEHDPIDRHFDCALPVISSDLSMRF